MHLGRKVERAFFEAGKALAQLRDRRLYRSTHRTFEEYCRDRFGYTHRRVNYLIAGSVVFDNSDSLEETVKSLLQSLGKVNRPYLTAVEEKLLNVLEIESRV